MTRAGFASRVGARMLAARRHYIPINVPLVKRIAAVAGELDDNIL